MKIDLRQRVSNGGRLRERHLKIPQSKSEFNASLVYSICTYWTTNAYIYRYIMNMHRRRNTTCGSPRKQRLSL